MREFFPRADDEVVPRWKRQYDNDRGGCKRRQKKYYSSKKEWFREFRRNLRQEAIEAYGGKCVCCGESHWQFLTLDHPNGDGQKDRAKHRMVLGQLYGWVKKNGYPQGMYRVLCMNCNWVRRFGGKCPHDG